MWVFVCVPLARTRSTNAAASLEKFSSSVSSMELSVEDEDGDSDWDDGIEEDEEEEVEAGRDEEKRGNAEDNDAVLGSG